MKKIIIKLILQRVDLTPITSKAIEEIGIQKGNFMRRLQKKNEIDDINENISHLIYDACVVRTTERRMA